MKTRTLLSIPEFLSNFIKKIPIKQICYLIIVCSVFFAVNSGNAQYVYNWFPSQSGTTNNLNFVNNNYCGGSNGTILHTNNGGLNWSPQTSGTSANLFGITLPTTALVMISGSNGTILRTTDNGSSWQQFPKRYIKHALFRC